MKIPSKLKIGGNVISIIRGQRPESGTDQDGGWSSWEDNEIFIADDMPQSRQETALLHEIFRQINVYLDEKEVTYLSESLYQVLKDNHLLK